jgi:type II secretory pathway pseudopilin PulG
VTRNRQGWRPAAGGVRQWRELIHARRYGGISLLELVVALAVLSVLGYFLLKGIAYVQEAAEQTAMERTVSALEFGLRYEAASRVAGGRQRDKAELARLNPMQWLARPPENYLGELQQAPDGAKARGSWYFDPEKREVVYRLRFDEHFRPARKGSAELRWQVVVEGPEATGGAALRLLTPYEWF